MLAVVAPRVVQFPAHVALFSQYSRILANVSLVLVQKMITRFVNLSVREHLRGHPALLRAAVCDLADLLWL